jgi:superoxide reductase
MRISETINPPEYEGKEKHVPQVHAPEKVKAGEWFEVTIIVGEEVPHPNTPEHHITWISAFYKEDGPRPIYEVAQFIPAPVSGDSRFSFRMKIDRPGQIVALEHCNIHGLWDNSRRLEVE